MHFNWISIVPTENGLQSTSLWRPFLKGACVVLRYRSFGASFVGCGRWRRVSCVCCRGGRCNGFLGFARNTGFLGLQWQQDIEQGIGVLADPCAQCIRRECRSVCLHDCRIIRFLKQGHDKRLYRCPSFVRFACAFGLVQLAIGGFIHGYFRDFHWFT